MEKDEDYQIVSVTPSNAKNYHNVRYTVGKGSVFYSLFVYGEYELEAYKRAKQRLDAMSARDRNRGAI